MPLDGGLATELERAGHDVSSSLWSARLLRDDPAAIEAAHGRFFQAGARVATTASYQVSEAGFAAAGFTAEDAGQAYARSVELAVRAREHAGLADRAWVAASIGPYGAMLADGSEYTGAYTDPGWTGRTQGGLTVAELRAFHRPRLAALADAGADVLACETIPAAAEVEALLAELDALGVPAWLSLTSTLAADGAVLTRRGEPAGEVFAMARDVSSVVAVGVNCTHPAGVQAAVEVASAASDKPVVAYPNSGEHWAARARRWSGEPGLSAVDVRGWCDAGARLVGGCCRIGPEQLRPVVTAALAEAARLSSDSTHPIAPTR